MFFWCVNNIKVQGPQHWEGKKKKTQPVVVLKRVFSRFLHDFKKKLCIFYFYLFLLVWQATRIPFDFTCFFFFFLFFANKTCYWEFEFLIRRSSLLILLHLVNVNELLVTILFCKQTMPYADDLHFNFRAAIVNKTRCFT